MKTVLLFAFGCLKFYMILFFFSLNYPIYNLFEKKVAEPHMSGYMQLPAVTPVQQSDASYP